MHLFDAHNHLQDERLRPELTQTMERARAAGVNQMVCCGSEEGDWAAVLELAAAHSGVVASLGLHPWYVGKRSDPWLATLRDAIRPGACAVGEIGLDHAISVRDDAAQERVFLDQLALSCEMQLPVSIHCRKAWGRMIELLTPLGPHPAGMVFHAYSGSADLVPELCALNAFFSFGGSLTYSGNKRGHRAAAAVPACRLLIETDAPDIPPLPCRAAAGEVQSANEPANLVYSLRALAACRGVSEAEMAAATTTNAQRVFGELFQ